MKTTQGKMTNLASQSHFSAMIHNTIDSTCCREEGSTHHHAGKRRSGLKTKKQDEDQNKQYQGEGARPQSLVRLRLLGLSSTKCGPNSANIWPSGEQAWS